MSNKSKKNSRQVNRTPTNNSGDGLSLDELFTKEQSENADNAIAFLAMLVDCDLHTADEIIKSYKMQNEKPVDEFIIRARQWAQLPHYEKMASMAYIAQAIIQLSILLKHYGVFANE